MRLAEPQMNAGARRQGVIRAADVDDSLALEYQHYLVIGMAMLRCPARRDLADELGSDGAAAVRAEHDAEATIPGGLYLAVTQEAGCRPGIGSRLAICCGEADRIEPQRSWPPGGDPVPDSWRHEQPLVRLEHQAGSARDGELAVSGEHEPQRAGRARPLVEVRSGRNFDEPSNQASVDGPALGRRGVKQQPHLRASGLPLGLHVGSAGDSRHPDRP